MVEADLGVPDRVPQLVRQLPGTGKTTVQEHEIDVAVRRAFPATQTPGGDERHAVGGAAGRRVQPGEPYVERRRTLLACGGANSY